MTDQNKKIRDAAKIARGNDALRKIGTISGFGRFMVTASLNEHPKLADILEAVKAFEDFNADNDPYGEHDCAILMVCGEKIMFKIDYYDSSFMYGADPYEDENFIRVLTVMYAHER